MAVLLALAAAISNSLTTVLQRSAARFAPESTTMRLGLIVYLVKRPIWLAGLGAMISGFVFQVFALHFGDLSSVQPILVTEIVFLVIILWLWFGIPVGAREWLGSVGIAVGLGIFLYVAHPVRGDSNPDLKGWLAGGLAGLVAVSVAVALALPRRRSPRWRAAWFGTGAAIAYAFAAALMKEGSDLSPHGFAHLFATGVPYGVVGVGLIGMFLAQNAFRSGPVGASQSALTIIDPLASIIIGVGLFGDTIDASRIAIAVEILAMATMVAGVAALTSSPLIGGAVAHDSKLVGRRRRASRLSSESVSDGALVGDGAGPGEAPVEPVPTTSLDPSAACGLKAGG